MLIRHRGLRVKRRSTVYRLNDREILILGKFQNKPGASLCCAGSEDGFFTEKAVSAMASAPFNNKMAMAIKPPLKLVLWEFQT